MKNSKHGPILPIILLVLVAMAVAATFLRRIVPELRERVMAQLANAMDMDVAELQDEMSSGKSVREIAEERGVSMDDLRAAFAGSRWLKG